MKKLDVLANECFIGALTNSGVVCNMVSEEDDGHMVIEDWQRAGKYVVCFDPLDGSSNIDCNVAIGSIFGIWHRRTPLNGPTSEVDVLQPGADMVACGYTLYGSTTLIMLAFKGVDGVQGYTLDAHIGEFVHTHANIRIPEVGKIYSVNEGNFNEWDAPTQQYVAECRSAGQSLRYVGSMVSDVHRTLLYGGTFLYPHSKKAPTGKLRYLYEVSPMSMLVERAGGTAFCHLTTSGRSLDLAPKSIHQRVPIFLGSNKNIERLKGIMTQAGLWHAPISSSTASSSSSSASSTTTSTTATATHSDPKPAHTAH